MKLETDNIILRPWQPGDEQALVKHGNNFKIWQNLRDTFPHPYTLPDAEHWVRTANEDPKNVNLAIITEGEAVGGIGFIIQEDVYFRCCERGCWLGEAYWNKGIATKVVNLITPYIFQEYNIYRIFTGVFAHNKGSLRVMEKTGFALEGLMRKSVTKNGQTIDEYLFALVKEKC